MFTTATETRPTLPMEFDEHVAVHRSRIFRFALASLRDRDAAETITQDCLLRAFRAWPEFRGDSSVQTWLMKIAINLIRDAVRNRRLQFWKRTKSAAILFDFLPDTATSPEQRASARQQVEAVWKALDQLSPGQQRVFLLHFMEELDAPEIAEVTGMSYATVRVHLSRGVRKVRQYLTRVQ